MLEFREHKSEKKHLVRFAGWPGSVRLRFGGGTVQAVPVFGSGGSSAKRFFCVSVQFNREGRFRFLENSGGGENIP